MLLKGKVVPVSFKWAPHHEGVLGEWRYSSTHSLTLALDGGKWSASCPSHFTPRKRAPGTHRIRSCVGPRAILDMVVKRKIPGPYQESNPTTPIIQPIAQCYTNWAITALILKMFQMKFVVCSRSISIQTSACLVPTVHCLLQIDTAATYTFHVATILLFHIPCPPPNTK
jgi:hypothetical protein